MTLLDIDAFIRVPVCRHIHFFLIALIFATTSCGSKPQSNELPIQNSPSLTSSPTVGAPIPTPTTTPGRVRVLVERVLDGETIEIGGGSRVLYRGVDAPELLPLECYGSEAAARNRQLVEGKWVEMETDGPNLDSRFGYYQRYIFVDGQLVNVVLLREGYARTSSDVYSLRLASELLQAQEMARTENIGVWRQCRP